DGFVASLRLADQAWRPGAARAALGGLSRRESWIWLAVAFELRFVRVPRMRKEAERWSAPLPFVGFTLRVSLWGSLALTSGALVGDVVGDRVVLEGDGGGCE